MDETGRFKVGADYYTRRADWLFILSRILKRPLFRVIVR
jgi:hypothetical protein